MDSWLPYDNDQLRLVLTGKENEDRWSSDPQNEGFSMITIELKESVMVAIDGYWLKSGFPGSGRWPFPKSWELYGWTRFQNRKCFVMANGMTSLFRDIGFRPSMQFDSVKQGETSVDRVSFTLEDLLFMVMFLVHLQLSDDLCVLWLSRHDQNLLNALVVVHSKWKLRLNAN
jgi:hypothetical protein